jgi:GNAT superfamily N-acetyltransferase
LDATIRAAGPGDERILAELNALVHEIHLCRRPDVFKPTDLDELAAWFQSLLPQAHVRAWIAEREGAPIGYVLAFHHKGRENPFQLARPWCEIDQIAVQPTSRNRGVARTLIQKVLDDADAENIRFIELNTWSFNEAAQQAFAQLGFIPKMVRYELG